MAEEEREKIDDAGPVSRIASVREQRSDSDTLKQARNIFIGTLDLKLYSNLTSS